MRILIATTQVPFVHGGAESHASGLCAALRAHGHQAEIVAIPFQWFPAGRILDHMLACRLLDLTHSNGQPIDRLIALKFPAYLLPHPHKVVWLLHQFRTAYDLWPHDMCDLIKAPDGVLIRDAIHQADRQAFAEAQTIFTNSRAVSSRLQDHLGIGSTPLYHPPPHAEEFRSAEAGDYFFFPSRMTHQKRQTLCLRALAKTRHPVRLRFSGASDTKDLPRELEALAEKLGVSSRVQWLGRIGDSALREQYAAALGVLFPPLEEDYGYVTLEAMLAARPVITCCDSGGATELVLDGVTGKIVEPQPEALAAALDELWENRAKARQMGLAGREHYQSLGLSWSTVVEKLCS